LGVLLSFTLPLAIKKVSETRQKREKKRSLKDYLTFLYALQGVLEVGVGFPTALFQICQNRHEPLGLLFGKIYQRFEKGDSFEKQFRRAEIRHLDDWVSTSMRMIELGHRKGLGLSSFVKNLIPVIELEIRAHDRISELEKSLQAQAILAGLIPWFLGSFVHWFQPQITDSFIHSWEGKIIIVGILFWEVLGLWILKQSTRFY
jgi:Flp pilus assembly protein TadB